MSMNRSTLRAHGTARQSRCRWARWSSAARSTRSRRPKLSTPRSRPGVNVVDTANVYAAGRSEEILGRLIGSKRDRLIVATKFSVPTDSQDPNSGGTSRRTVIAACEASLRRLGTDYIDVYYIHRPFTQTAIDETLRALDDLVRAGKVRYIGSSGTSGWQLVDMLWAAHDLGLNRPVVEQTAYHLLDRRAERDLVPAALTHDTALTVWSPLAGGLLTGKYLGQQATDARLSPTDAWGAKHFTPQANTAVARLAECARQAGVTLTALSLAWTLQRPGITGVVLGPRSTHQLAGPAGGSRRLARGRAARHDRPDRAARRRHRAVLPRRQLRRLPAASLPLVAGG